MAKFSWISKLKNLFKGSSTITKVTDGAGKIIRSSETITKVSKWGSAVKVAVAGFIGYWILDGGLVRGLSSTLGIPEWMSTVILVVIFGAVIYLLLTFLSGWLSKKLRVNRTKPEIERKVRSAPKSYYNTKKNSYNNNKKKKKYNSRGNKY